MEQAEKVQVGLIGCGEISSAYLKTAANVTGNIEYAACADTNMERARMRAEEFSIPASCSTDELLRNPDISVVVNLTPPRFHFPVSMAILEAGKHAYSEKPMAVSSAEAGQLLDFAHARGLRYGCAPDTFMGAGLQTCRKLIDDGAIGEPVGFAANFLSNGIENWHPEPAFFYQEGGGPLFDMGPYYITALINMIGRVSSVSAMSRLTFPQRVITSERHKGKIIDVQTPTHIVGSMQFDNQAIGSITTSFDIKGSKSPRLEIYGSEGTISAPDPNTFGGPVELRQAGRQEWHEVPLTHGYAQNSRGIGLADMAGAIVEGRPHRANESMARHTVEIMEGLLTAARTGARYAISSVCERPAALSPAPSAGRRVSIDG